MRARGGVKGLTSNGIPIDPNLRILAFASLVNTIGNGALMATSVLYLSRILAFTPGEVAFVLSCAAIGAVATQVPLGALSDERGPRGILALLTGAAGLLYVTLVFATSVPAVAILLTLAAVAERGAWAVRQGVIPRIADGNQGVSFKAYLRSITNVGLGIGGLVAGLALSVDTAVAYRAVIVLNGVSFLVAAVLLRGLPMLTPAPPRRSGEARFQVLRDLPFAAVTLLLGLFSMHFALIELAIPLWIVQAGGGPGWLVAATLLVNTIAVAAFQVRAARSSTTVATGAFAIVRASIWVAVACAMFAFAPSTSPVLLVMLVLAGAGLHVVGEMLGSAGQWAVSMGLAPAERHGQYQSFGGLSLALAGAIAPPAIAILCVDGGVPGWFVFIGIIVGSALLLKPAAAWAARTRSEYGVTTHTG